MGKLIKCIKCGKQKEIKDFTDSTSGKQFAKCNECRKQAKEWREKNSERVKEYNKLVRETKHNQKKTKIIVYGKKVDEDESKWVQYESQQDVSDKLKIDKSNISKVISGKSKSAKGYEFKTGIEKNEKKKLDKWQDIVDEKFKKKPVVSPNRISHIKTEDGTELKKCSSCKRYKVLMEFSKDSSNWDKLRSNCKECQKKTGDDTNEKKDEQYLKPKEKEEKPKTGNINKKPAQKKRGGGKKRSHKKENGEEYKYCPTCKKWKIFKEFNKQLSSWDNLARMCRDCNIKFKRDKRKNETKYKEYDTKYYKKYAKSGRRAEVNKIWYKNNRTIIIKRMVEYNKKRYHSDPTYRLLTICRRRFNRILSNQNVKKE